MIFSDFSSFFKDFFLVNKDFNLEKTFGLSFSFIAAFLCANFSLAFFSACIFFFNNSYLRFNFGAYFNNNNGDAIKTINSTSHIKKVILLFSIRAIMARAKSIIVMNVCPTRTNLSPSIFPKYKMVIRLYKVNSGAMQFLYFHTFLRLNRVLLCLFCYQALFWVLYLQNISHAMLLKH